MQLHWANISIDFTNTGVGIGIDIKLIKCINYIDVQRTPISLSCPCGCQCLSQGQQIATVDFEKIEPVNLIDDLGTRKRTSPICCA